MNDIRQAIRIRLGNLEQLIDIKTRAVEKAHEGRVKVDRTHGKTHYYCIRSDGRKVPVSENDARIIAQKSYDAKIVRSAKREHALLNRTLTSYPKDYVENIINCIPQDRIPLITPVRRSDIEYAEAWMASPYRSKGGVTEGFKTKKGDIVRSKSELIIADRLFDMGIPYRYEAELRLGTVTIYPDFTILDVKNRREVYLEHLGMMGNPDYASNSIRRISLYSKHNLLIGDRLFITMESSDVALDIGNLERLISRFVVQK